MADSVPCPAKIVLYTNHDCPYCQRVHITMKELGIAPTEEIAIDLEKSREPWYLDINPVSVSSELPLPLHASSVPLSCSNRVGAPTTLSEVSCIC